MLAKSLLKIFSNANFKFVKKEQMLYIVNSFYFSAVKFKIMYQFNEVLDLRAYYHKSSSVVFIPQVILICTSMSVILIFAPGTYLFKYQKSVVL